MLLILFLNIWIMFDFYRMKPWNSTFKVNHFFHDRIQPGLCNLGGLGRFLSFSVVKTCCYLKKAVMLRPLIKSLALKPQGWEFTNARWLHYVQSRRSRLVTLTQAQEFSSVKLLEELLCCFNIDSLGFAFSNELEMLISRLHLWDFCHSLCWLWRGLKYCRLFLDVKHIINFTQNVKSKLSFVAFSLSVRFVAIFMLVVICSLFYIK